jgi:formylmethanofuran dehydrogenase subunit E
VYSCPDCGEFWFSEAYEHHCPPTIYVQRNDEKYWVYTQCKECHRNVMTTFKILSLGQWVCSWCKHGE